MTPELLQLMQSSQSKSSTGTTRSSGTAWDRYKKLDVEDLKMVEEEGQVIVAVPRRTTSSSQLLLDLLKRFDEANGYDHLIEALGKPETSLHNLKELISIVSQCSELFHKTFIDKFFDRIKDAAEAKLLNADEKHLRETRFDAIQDIVEAIWLKVMSRMAPNM